MKNKRAKPSAEVAEPGAGDRAVQPPAMPTARPISGAELRRRRAQSLARPGGEHVGGIIRRAPRSAPEGGARISKPLAAYRLGHLSRTLWMWHQVFWTMPEYEGTDDGVPFAADQIQEACLVLSREIHPNVFRDLPRVLGDLKKGTEILVEAYHQAGHYRGFPFGSPHVPGSDHWQELTTLTDAALDESDPLRVLYDLGVAIGDYELRMQYYEPDPDAPGDLDALPDIRPLIRCLESLPEQYHQHSTLLRSLVELAPVLDQHGQSVFLVELFEKERDTWNHISNYVNCLEMTKMFETLDRHVEEELEEMASLPSPTSSEIAKKGPEIRPIRNEGDVIEANEKEADAQAEPPRLVWDSKRRCLLFEGKFARNARRKASYIPILEEFQKQNWPPSIVKPIKFCNDDNYIYEVIKTLNAGLKYLKFHVDGAEIRWEELPEELPEKYHEHLP